VYTAEWNDWRKTGPVHTIREICPACQGVTTP
jgi:rRNA maturation protein Nop10